MTEIQLRRLLVAVAIAAGIFVYAWLMTLLPLAWSIGLRAANGFAMIVLLVLYHREFRRLLLEVLELVKATELKRQAAVTKLEERADRMDSAVEMALERRQAANHTALQSQTKYLGDKIDEATAASKEAQTEANHANRKIADLDQRLLEAIPPKDQIDDIQHVSHEARDIIAVVEKKVGKP